MFSMNRSKVASKTILRRGSSKLKHMLTLAFAFGFCLVVFVVVVVVISAFNLSLVLSNFSLYSNKS